MNLTLTIFELCKSEHREIGKEDSLKASWGGAPSIGDVVSMGWQHRWEVVKLTPFKPTVLEREVEQIVIAHLQRVDLAPIPVAEWTCEALKGDCPYLSISGVETEPLQMGYYCNDFTPRLGEVLTRSVPAGPTVDWGDGLISQPMRSEPTEWVTDRFDVYLPVAPESPYPTIYLTWCVRDQVLQAA